MTSPADRSPLMRRTCAIWQNLDRVDTRETGPTASDFLWISLACTEHADAPLPLDLAAQVERMAALVKPGAGQTSNEERRASMTDAEHDELRQLVEDVYKACDPAGPDS